MDEPFASLDQHLRELLREELRDVQQRLKITALFATHGQDEALALADRSVAGFIGSMNMIDGDVAGGVFRHPLLSVAAPVPDGPVRLAVRPEAVALRQASGPKTVPVHRAVDSGTHAVVDVLLSEERRL